MSLPDRQPFGLCARLRRLHWNGIHCGLAIIGYRMSGVDRIALIALASLLSGCSLFLPTGTSCSNRMPMFSSCPPAASVTPRRAATLADTYWKLARLGDTAVRDGLLLREPHLRLDSNRQLFAGSGGCNAITGRYSLDGSDGIRFLDLGTTKMACSGMVVEQDFLKSLEETVRWRIDGDNLLLMNAGDKPVGAFRAVHDQ
jgi:heat shock protein HslJ